MSQQTTQTPAPAGHTVTIEGRPPFNLAAIQTRADADKLYAALPAAYQRKAVVLKYQLELIRKINEVKPANMTLAQAWDIFTSGSKDIDDTNKVWLKRFEEAAQPIVDAGNKTLGTGWFANSLGAVGSAANGFSDGLALPFSILGAGSAIMGAFGGAAMSSDQAFAIATMFSAALYEEGKERRNLPFWSWTPWSEKSQFWQNPGAASQAAVEYATLNVPILSDMWPYVRSFFIWAKELVQSFTSNTPARSFNEILDWVKKDRAAVADTTWEGLTNQKVGAADMARAAEYIPDTVLGYDARKVRELIGRGGVVADRYGNQVAYTPDGNGVATGAQKDSNGNPISPYNQAKDAITGALDPSQLSNPLYLGTAALGTYAAGNAIYGAAEGVARRFVGPTSGPVLRAAGATAADAATVAKAAERAGSGFFGNKPGFFIQNAVRPMGSWGEWLVNAPRVAMRKVGAIVATPIEWGMNVATKVVSAVPGGAQVIAATEQASTKGLAFMPKVAAKILGPASVAIAPAWSTYDFVDASQRGDAHGQTKAGLELGTIGAGAAAGAVMGGPPGALAGAVVGSVVTMASGIVGTTDMVASWLQSLFSGSTPPPPTPTPDDKTPAAAQQAIQLNSPAVKGAGMAMANSRVSMGSQLVDGTPVVPDAAPAVPVGLLSPSLYQ